MKFKVGDVVFHQPTRNKFVVAAIWENNFMPLEKEIIILFSDCYLIIECTAEESLEFLRKLAAMNENAEGIRSAMAYRELVNRGEINYVIPYINKISKELSLTSIKMAYLTKELFRAKKIFEALPIKAR